MLTAQKLVFAMLEYVGEFSLTFSEYTGTTGMGLQRALISAINEGQEELFQRNPSLFKREVGATLPAPVTGSLSVTDGSDTVTSPAFTGYTSFCGQTIQIAGMSEFNAIRTEAGTHKLVFPYRGTTGSKGATLYGDVLALDSTLSRPLGPVWISDTRILTPLAGKGEFLAYDPRQQLNTDWGFYRYGINRMPRPKMVCQPEAYWVDVHTLEAGTPQIRLQVVPLPDKDYSLRFDAGVRPLPVAWDTDIGADDNTDPNRLFAMPEELDMRFLKPIALYHFSRSAFFKNADARKQIAADRAALLPEIDNWKVQPSTGGHIQTGGWR